MLNKCQFMMWVILPHIMKRSNWIIKVQLSDPSELDALMDAEAYKEQCKE